MKKGNAILRVAFNIKNPEELDQKEWAKLYQEWIYMQRIQLNAQAAMFESTLRKVLVEVLNAAFGK